MCALVSRLGFSVLSGLLVVVLAHPAAATSTTFDFNFAFAIDNFSQDAEAYQQFSGSQLGMVPQFDDQGGNLILEQVTLDLVMTIDGSVVYSNGQAGQFTTYFEPHFSGLALVRDPLFVQDLLSVDLLNSDFAPAIGSQGLPLQFIVAGTGANAVGIPSDDLSPFIGTDMLGVFVQAGVNVPFGGLGVAEEAGMESLLLPITLGPTTASGTASLTYLSNPIPEPNSALLFVSGSLVIGTALRRKS